jgi:hypothetical protein
LKILLSSTIINSFSPSFCENEFFYKEKENGLIEEKDDESDEKKRLYDDSSRNNNTSEYVNESELFFHSLNNTATSKLMLFPKLKYTFGIEEA